MVEVIFFPVSIFFNRRCVNNIDFRVKVLNNEFKNFNCMKNNF